MVWWEAEIVLRKSLNATAFFRDIFHKLQSARTFPVRLGLEFLAAKKKSLPLLLRVRHIVAGVA